MFKRFLIVVLALILMLTGCVGEGAHAVRDGRLRDTIYGVESKANGSYFVWMTHDDVGVYCTMDAALYQKALDIFNNKATPPEVFIKYTSNNVGSSTRPDMLHDPLGVQGCSHDAATVYVFTDVDPVNPQPQ